jgi:Bacterial Ig domain
VNENVATDTPVGITVLWTTDLTNSNGMAAGMTASSAAPPDGTVTFSVTDNAGGRFQIDADTGVVTVTDGSLIDFESNGYPIKVQASDDTEESDEVTFVVFVNRPPVVNNINDVSVLHGRTTAIDLAANASDPDNDPLTISIVQNPSHGSVAYNATTLRWDYTASATYVGPDSFTFKANDGHLDSNTATVSITVRRINHAPVANDGAAVTDQNTPVGITLVASDPDGDALSYAIVSGPGHGALSGTGASRTYAPAAGYSGPDSFTFKASDGQLDSNVATVSITVRRTLTGCAICIVGPLSATNLVSSGSGSIRAVDGSILINGETRVVGDTTVAAPAIGVDGPLPSGGNWSPQPEALGAPVADPLASLPVPAVTGACQSVDVGNTESVTLEPGVYCSISGSGKSRIVLDPGLYVVTDGIRLTGSSSLTGTGVTVYLTSPRGASVTFTGDTTVTLTAPTSGPLRGVALFFERTSGGSLSLSQNSGMTVEGAVYGRSASLELNGTPSLTTRGGPIVVAELRRVGNATVSATLAG